MHREADFLTDRQFNRLKDKAEEYQSLMPSEDNIYQMSTPEDNKAKFHLIGLSHRAQMKDKGQPDSDAQKEFRNCLEATLDRVRPNFVAEELSTYALKKVAEEKGIEQESLSQLIARSKQVEHRFCDPDDEERKRMGYVDGSTMVLDLMLGDEPLSNDEINLRAFATEVHKHWPAREEFWLDKLEDVKGKVVIFVCGDGHIDTFKSLLERSGIESTVIKRGIGLTKHDIEFTEKLKHYIEEHPELFT